jgi:hypothetical protein
MLEVTSLAKHGGVSRPTVMNWLEVFQVTHVAHLLRPFAGGARREILSQPKIYAFDTGFVCYARGWDSLRDDDCGLLWEHLVLDTLLSIPLPKLHFWRDKQGREVDFVHPMSRDRIDAIECKWNVDAFDPGGLAAFRERYPRGRNFLAGPNVVTPFSRQWGSLEVSVVSPRDLRSRLTT